MIRLLVTAASSDLGSALIAEMSARNDIALLTTSRKKIVPSAGPNHLHLSNIDLVTEKDLKKIASKANTFFDGPFSIVHFAGNYWHHKPLIHTDFSEIRELMESHYLSLCGIARFLTPVLLKKGGGRLIAMSCNSVSYNYPDLSPFTAPKAAVESFIKSFANEYAEFGITATAIALPTMRTSKVVSDKIVGDHANYISPNEFAGLVLEEIVTQSRYVTGNTVRLIKHSPTFYHESYFQRNPRNLQIK